MKPSWLFLVNPCKMNVPMKTIVRKFVTVFGICVISVSLFSGCATQPMPERVPMTSMDLNYYQVDCRRKQEQVQFLQSMRISQEEQFAARMRLMWRSDQLVTNPRVYLINYDMAHGNPNKYINYLLRELAEC
jgi:hypothetical protein